MICGWPGNHVSCSTDLLRSSHAFAFNPSSGGIFALTLDDGHDCLVGA
jgi:hypothetical protein